MTDNIINDLTTTRLSETIYKIKVYKQDGTPQPVDGLPLILIAKKKMSDADADAVFTLSVGSGIEVDPDVAEGNGLVITIATDDTETMPETKDSTLYCELIMTGPNRKTLGDRFTVPVLASLKRS
jgi:hypothetical protein